MQNPNQPHITGTAINYLYICERKLWFFQNHLEMEHTSEYIALGQLLHEDTYPRARNGGNGSSMAWCASILLIRTASFTTSNPVPPWRQRMSCNSVITSICSSKKASPSGKGLSTTRANVERPRWNLPPIGSANWRLPSSKSPRLPRCPHRLTQTT